MLYELYGVPVKCGLALNAPRLKAGKPFVVISRAPENFFEKVLPASYQDSKVPVDYLLLSGGAVFIRFFQVFRFWVSANGRKILYREINSKHREAPYISPLIFLQTNVFSFSLIRLGHEVFHASCVGAGRKAVAFLGESGYGKSTLAASFLKEGFPLLTDDVLAVRKKGKSFWTPPGVSQIKLFPAMAKKILKRPLPAEKMSPIAKKWILPLDRQSMSRERFEIGVLYVLWPRFKKGASTVRIKKLRPQEALISLIKSSHNLVIQDSKRLQKQMLFASELVKKVPVRAVSFPMDLKKIPVVREKLQKDITQVFARPQKQRRPTAVQS